MKQNQEQALRRKIGDLNAHCGWKDYVYNDGPARGVRALDLDNGRNVQLTVLADRGLDVSSLRFKGKQAAFLSKTGVKSPALYQEEGGRGFLRQFYAGFLTTCGISYAGAAHEEDGVAYGLHGPFSNTPAGKVCAETVYERGEAVLRVSGEIRQNQVFAENLVTRRELKLYTEKDLLTLEDTVENQGHFDSPMMLVYHVNFGYPLLDAGARVYSAARDVGPRDADAKKAIKKYHLMEEPSPQRPEECFFHTGLGEDAFAMLHNEALGLAAVVRFDGRELPLMCEWKCMREGDYALGLEPTTSGVMGRPAARKDGLLVTLKPGERRVLKLAFEFLDDPKAIRKYVARSREKDFKG